MIALLNAHGADILAGFLTTLRIVGFGFVIGAVVGTSAGLARGYGPRALDVVIGACVEIVRNTPFLVQAMVVFAVLAAMRLRWPPDAVGTGIVAVYTAAYMCEIVRGALRAVPAGQTEAALALGLRRRAALRLVVLPQIVPYVAPAGANLLATVVKESAFLSAVAVAELTYAGQVVIARTFAVFEVWAIVAILYLGLVLAVQAAADHLEKRLLWTKTR